MLSVFKATRPDDAQLRLVIVDNDATPSAQSLVDETAAQIDVQTQYCHAPGANISIARNAALDAVTGADLVCFLDDDETVDQDWLIELIAAFEAENADAVFGHSKAIYGQDAPDWMSAGDFHSQYVTPRNGEIETGHTCNVMMRLKNTPWQNERFDIAFGRSGGEDTEFFFRLRRLGARYAVAPNALTFEDVPPERASFGWLKKRRFRIGQSYASVEVKLHRKVKLFCLAAVKASYCSLRAALCASHKTSRAFWTLRGTMHWGVCAGCLRLQRAALYGENTT